MDQNFQHDVRRFEAFLVQKGFSSYRAGRIAAQGYRAACSDSSDGVELMELVGHVQQRKQRLSLKGFREEFQIWAPPLPLGRWGRWFRFKGVTSHPTLRSSFEMKFSSGSGDLAGPFEIEVKYVSPSGRRTQKLLSPSSASFELPLNSIQEPQVRARSLTLNGQFIHILKYGS